MPKPKPKPAKAEHRSGKADRAAGAGGWTFALVGAAGCAAALALGGAARHEEAACWLDGLVAAPEPAETAGHPEGVTSGSAEHNATMLWGTYRPQVYFGMRTREEKSFLFGFGWGTRGRMRYTAEDDEDVTFGWEAHDGVRFGEQRIVDRLHGVELTTTFVKRVGGAPAHGGTWTVRVAGRRIPTTKGRPAPKTLLISPVFASEVEKLAPSLAADEVSAPVVEVGGQTAAAGIFRVRVGALSGGSGAGWNPGTAQKKAGSEWEVDFQRFHRRRESVAQPGKVANAKPANQLQLLQEAAGDFSFEVTLVQEAPGAAAAPTGCAFQRAAAQRRGAFEARFAEVFGRPGAGRVDRFALSNMLGGMGYWFGDAVREEGKRIPPLELFSGVPSRAKFPRGFLWDEGFHQLLIGRWNPELSKDVLRSWVRQMEPDGWIPREQIRGAEPRSRVPAEFVAQDPSIANPPTLLLQLQTFAVAARRGDVPRGEMEAFARHMYPFMRRWQAWFKKTQAGPREHTFRWRGQNGYHLLSCGLDDYPRSRCHTDDELHVDLHSWMVLMAETLHTLAEFLGLDADAAELAAERSALRRSLLENHWSAERGMFADVAGCPPREDGKPVAKHVGYVGYVNLFPLLCGALDAQADKDKVLAVVRLAAKHLLGPFGLRSLSEKSAKKLKRHDNYWTGPIWINLNYMFSRALRQYGYAAADPEVAEFGRLLDERVPRLIREEYERTGKIWENYDPETGRGRGTAPFTGWTSLFLLM